MFCQRCFYFLKVLKVPRLPSQEMVKGSIIHELYKRFFREMEHLKKESIADFAQHFMEKEKAKVLGRWQKTMKNLSMDEKELGGELDKIFAILFYRLANGFSKVPKFVEREFIAYGMKARPDMVFEENGSLKIGDIKLKGEITLGTKLQLTVGAILLQKNLNKGIERGVIINGQDWTEKEMLITKDLRDLVFDIRDDIRAFLKDPFLPKKPRYVKNKEWHVCLTEAVPEKQVKL